MGTNTLDKGFIAIFLSIFITFGKKVGKKVETSFLVTYNCFV